MREEERRFVEQHMKRARAHERSQDDPGGRIPHDFRFQSSCTSEPCGQGGRAQDAKSNQKAPDLERDGTDRERVDLEGGDHISGSIRRLLSGRGTTRQPRAHL